MRALTLLLICLMGIGAARCGEIADSPEARVAAAKRYYEVSDFPRLIDATIRASAAARDPQHVDEVVQLMSRHLNVDALAHIMLNAMVKDFTAEELNALADFYGSSVGKSAMSKFPNYLSDAMPQLMAEIQRTVAEIQEEVNSKHAAS